MTVSIVVAIGENNAIEKDNELLWYLPTDLKAFQNDHQRAHDHHGPQDL